MSRICSASCATTRSQDTASVSHTFNGRLHTLLWVMPGQCCAWQITRIRDHTWSRIHGSSSISRWKPTSRDALSERRRLVLLGLAQP